MTAGAAMVGALSPSINTSPKVPVVQELVHLMHEKYFGGKPHKFVDSSCGSGTVVAALRDLGHTTWAFDVDVSNAPISIGAARADWLALKSGDVPFPRDTCVGFNPPFGYAASEARQFVTQAAALAPSAPFLFFIAPHSLVYGVVRGTKWAPHGFRVVGEHRVADNSFFTPRDGKDFHTDAFFFVFSPGEEAAPARTTTTVDGVTIQSIPVKIGTNKGRVPLHKILKGRRQNAGATDRRQCRPRFRHQEYSQEEVRAGYDRCGRSREEEEIPRTRRELEFVATQHTDLRACRRQVLGRTAHWQDGTRTPRHDWREVCCTRVPLYRAAGFSGVELENIHRGCFLKKMLSTASCTCW